jgi:hypothetical protein
MAELTSSFFRNYFAGSWLARIVVNGQYLRNIEFNWPEAFSGKYASIGTEEGFVAPPGIGFYDNTRKVEIAGWRQDLKRWSVIWYNEYGGYGEMHWTSQEYVNGFLFLHGFGLEFKQEGDEPTEHILQCEITDKNNFKSSLRSFKKGTIEIKAKRIRTAQELRMLTKKEVEANANLDDTSY